MSRLIRIAVVLVLICTMTGCTKEKKNKETINLNESNMMDINLINKQEEDAQSYWGGLVHNFARGEGGYYYQSNSDFLMFFDCGQKESYPVCGIPDCAHNSNSCNAYIGHGIGKEQLETYYLLQTVYYYKGYIYLLDNNGNLVRVTPDGSSREVVANVYVYEGRTGINLVFYDDSVYVYDRNPDGDRKKERTATITRYSLDGKEKEVAVEYRGIGTVIANAKAYGNQLLFSISNLNVKEEDGKREYYHGYDGLYVYNMDTGKCGKTIDKSITDYCVDSERNQLYYFEDGKGLYQYDIASKDTRKIMDADEQSQQLDLSFDGEYIYTSNNLWAGTLRSMGLENKRECRVIDTEGNIINKIDCTLSIRMFFGDDKYIFMENLETGKGLSFVYIDKSNIESATKWTELP